MVKEKARDAASGYAMLIGVLGGFVLTAAIIYFGANADRASTGLIVIGVLLGLASFFCTFGFFIVNPNQAVVLQLFGEYVGTVRATGLRWANPLYSKRPVSVRVRNFESDQMKVNDKDGNPIEIAAVVVWKVVDTAEAIFEVDDFEDFVYVQSESAVRRMAAEYPYDADGDEVSLRGHTDGVVERLEAEIQARLDRAGVKVLEARISNLAYAPEIAGAMLQRQQASAIIAARTKIVEGAVSMVEMALRQLMDQKVVAFSEEQKASMVANLLVILCGERGAQPVLSVERRAG
ncbi:SPFH domain / Band 7 family protein [Planctomycetes bacterium Pan216]|uniref:SPFH domain / Band 7 family protein n=1 Tax=Kolteria novifilia TaxID=2527975 RepID=A0A518AZT3_9BACT|nr:SPFH domain / Band 7 family protein [Planctomycetes bacterium Pan216]